MQKPAALLVPVLLTAVFFSPPVLSAEKEIAASRASYEKQLKAIEAKYGGKKGDWPGKYKAELKVLGRTVQADGNLEGFLAVRKELERFKASGRIPKDVIVETPLELRQLQEKYGAAKGSVSLGKSREILALVERYIDHVEQLKKKFTIAGDLETALAANKEIERVQSSETVTAAEFNIAVLQSEQPAEKTPPAGGDGPGEEEADKPPAANKAKPTAPPGYVVYPAGERPARVAGKTFTRLALNRTGNTSMSDMNVSVTASRSTSVSVSKGSSYYYSSKGTTRRSTIRLRVRCSRSGTILKDQIVNIQLFTKPVGDKGKVSPARVRVGSIKLPELTGAGVYIDCPDLSTTRRSTKSRYRRRRGRSGSDFYGILVSVYNSDGTLSYQGISASGLKKHAAGATTRGAK